VVVLSKRNNRLIVATADPSDQEAAEKIKFATQMGVDWIIAEYDKLSKLVEAAATTARDHGQHHRRRLRVRRIRRWIRRRRRKRGHHIGSRRRTGRQVPAQDAAGCVQHARI
jgi:hypothetical protein